jgi:hypothetical protein
MICDNCEMDSSANPCRYCGFNFGAKTGQKSASSVFPEVIYKIAREYISFNTHLCYLARLNDDVGSVSLDNLICSINKQKDDFKLEHIAKWGAVEKCIDEIVKYWNEDKRDSSELMRKNDDGKAKGFGYYSKFSQKSTQGGNLSPTRNFIGKGNT